MGQPWEIWLLSVRTRLSVRVMDPSCAGEGACASACLRQGTCRCISAMCEGVGEFGVGQVSPTCVAAAGGVTAARRLPEGPAAARQPALERKKGLYISRA